MGLNLRFQIQCGSEFWLAIIEAQNLGSESNSQQQYRILQTLFLLKQIDVFSGAPAKEAISEKTC